MTYSCCDTLRRDLVAASPTPLNGIDYLEVIDADLPSLDPLRQRTLLVHCLKTLGRRFHWRRTCRSAAASGLPM